MAEKGTLAASVLVLAVVALVTRLVIVDWTLPYPGNPAHEHSMIYDSQAVVHDQYRVLFGLYHFPRGLVAEAAEAVWPVLQRYLASPPLLIWLAAEHGWSLQRVLAAPFAETAYKTLLINRLISVVASIVALVLTWKLLRRFMPERLAFFLTAIFALSVSEIGTSIHEKTISLLTVMYVGEALLLERWARSQGKDFIYLVLACLLVGLAGTAREYGLLFGGLLAALVIVFVRGRRTWRLVFSREGPLLIVAGLAGILMGSPDMLVEIPYWVAATLEPGGRAWHSTTYATVPLELWAVGELLFGGSVGVAVFLAAVAYLAAAFRAQRPFIQGVVIWLILYLGIFALYPLKDLRFITGLAPFGFLAIGLFVYNSSAALRHTYARPGRTRGLAGLVLAVWLVQALVWSVSALVFFNGQDSRLIAAEDFNASVLAGTSVATLYPPYYNRQIPIDERKYAQYTYDGLHSMSSDIRYIPYGREEHLAKDSRGEFIGEPGIWPEYILLDFETGGYTYPSDQYTTHKFRRSVHLSGRYEVVRTYPKRQWQLGDYGLFGTRSRWLYFNPVVEVYRLKEG